MQHALDKVYMSSIHMYRLQAAPFGGSKDTDGKGGTRQPLGTYPIHAQSADLTLLLNDRYFRNEKELGTYLNG